MLRICLYVVALLFTPNILGEEYFFDFKNDPLNQTPAGFRSIIAGSGNPGEWKVIMDEVSPQLRPFTEMAPVVTKRPVLAQLSRDPADEHFPILVYDNDTFGDFTLTTKIKMVDGEKERMAGIAFRLQDEKNYYVVRASSLGNTFRFYKVVNGERGKLHGPDVSIPPGTWHELQVECKGNQIRCLLNGKELIPPLMDYSFTSGKIGFWTKSDSVSYFTDTKINYTRRDPLAKILLQDQLKRYPRLLGLKIFAMSPIQSKIVMIASDKTEEVGQLGGKPEEDVISRDVIYYGKDSQRVTVTLPLHDRNGDPIAAVRVTMKAFPGQTEQNAIARAMPIVKGMQSRVRTKSDLIPNF